MNNKELNHSNDKYNSVSSNQFIAKRKNNQHTDSLHLLVNEKNRIILSKKEKVELSELKRITTEKMVSRIWRVNRNTTEE